MGGPPLRYGCHGQLQICRPRGQANRSHIGRSATQCMHLLALLNQIVTGLVPRRLPIRKMIDKQSQGLLPQRWLTKHAVNSCRDIKTIKYIGYGHWITEMGKEGKVR